MAFRPVDRNNPSGQRSPTPANGFAQYNRDRSSGSTEPATFGWVGGHSATFDNIVNLICIIQSKLFADGGRFDRVPNDDRAEFEVGLSFRQWVDLIVYVTLNHVGRVG